VLGVLALILLIAMVILILRRRKQGKNVNSWILLAAKTQRVEEEKQVSVKLMSQTEL